MFTDTQLKKLIFPLMVEQALVVLVGMADTAMVSSLGEAAVSGVSLIDMISVVIINLFAAMATGGAVVCSQLLGAKKRREACNASNQLMLIVLVLSVAIAAILLLLRGPMIDLFYGKLDPDVRKNALIYLQITALSYPFIAVYNGAAAIFRSMSRSRITMYASALSNVINCAGNALCIYGFKMGVAGAAIPTLVARAVSAFILVFLLIRRPGELRLDFTGFRPDPPMIRRILTIGIPSGAENSLTQFVKIILMGIVSAFGTVQIAAHAVACVFADLGHLPAKAINLAVITVIGHCAGAQDIRQVKHYASKLLIWIYLSLFIVNIPLLIGLRQFIRVYDLAPETLDLACRLIIIHSVAIMILWPPTFAMPNVLRACNDVRFTMAVSLGSMLLFRLPFSFLLGRYLGMGVMGVWCVMIADWGVRLSFLAYRWKSGRWQDKVRT